MNSSKRSGYELLFLGTSASCGVPAYYCGCKVCEEARAHPEYARGCSSIMIRGAEDTLIDTSPELRLQFIRERLTRVDQILFTHEHFDHVGGLAQLEYYSKLVSGKPIPVYAGKECIEYLTSHFDFMADSLDFNSIKAFEVLEFNGVRYTPLPAAHAPGTFGYLIEIPTRGESALPVSTPRYVRIAYFPDTGVLPDQTRAYLGDLDILIHDATFNGRNWMPHSHTTIDEAISLAREIRPKVTYLTHLALHYDTPITVEELQEKLDEVNAAHDCDIRIAFDGMNIEV